MPIKVISVFGYIAQLRIIIDKKQEAHILLKTRFFGLHFSSRKCQYVFNHFYVMCLKATEFSEVTHGPYAIQGHRVWYQTKAHMRLLISD